ncbi:stromal membrane-associated protein 1 [Galendromus occidentalis]|uniref:Stromal membrane-associated protein 1 n=1 Tax=Galendromus occidentalis TaxID=34638 RepID=A0AAJ6QM45_9ACAR|nr:stromal membrane-associated protein 1 [Galendromus occidentalis]
MSNSSYRNSKADKQLQDKMQALLSHLLREEENKYCADCDAKGPRWASWNLGIFVCIRCAGIHRNLGVHISRVKSVNLDSWTDEQVGSMQKMGNSKGRAVYEANLPDGFRRPQNDSALETFIRGKYEHKKYIAREWVPPTKPHKADFSVLGGSAPTSRASDKKIELNAVASSIPRPNSSGNIKDMSSPSSPSQKSPTTALPSDDIFADFISAPLPAPVSVAPVAASTEEKDFFNQVSAGSITNPISPQPNSGAASRIDKESILSLYSKSIPGQPSMQSLGSHAANPLVSAGMGMPMSQQVANNPFLAGGMVNTQSSYGLGLSTQQGYRPLPHQQQQVVPQQFQSSMGNNLQMANFGAPSNGMAAGQQSNVGAVNAQFAGLRMGDPAGGGFPTAQLNPNGNSPLTSNLWH